MKTLLTYLIRFTAFTAVTFAVLFGLPALAEHHPFILFAVSLSVLILVVYTNSKAAKHRTATRRNTSQRTRIPNTYDSGYHFENVPVKERRLKIDF